jgi:hypothetical protein
MVRRMSRACAVASRVFWMMATRSSFSLPEIFDRSPENFWKLASVASSFWPL